MLKKFSTTALLTLLATSPLQSLAEKQNTVKVIEPKKKVTKAESAAIDTEKIQAGMFLGFLAAEDFNNNLISGLSISYQIRPNYFVQANFGRSEVDRATFEDVIGGNFLSSSDRNFQYINVLGGYRLFTARSFFGAKHKYDSDIYLLAGLGSVDFAGSSDTSLVWGASYRVVFTDWLVTTMDFRNHMANREFLDDDKMTQNIEFAIGFNAMF